MALFVEYLYGEQLDSENSYREKSRIGNIYREHDLIRSLALFGEQLSAELFYLENSYRQNGVIDV